MLDSKWLQDAPELVVELFSQVEIAILQDMARRITRYDYFIPAAQHQRRILEAVGESRKAITKALSDISGESEQAIRSLITEAGNRTIESDTKYYKAAEIYAADKVDEAALNAVLRSGLRQTLGEFKNITRTTVQAGGNQLYNVLNSAWLQVSTGAFDAETAIVNAVKQLAASGLNAVDYPSGRHDTLEVAVRRAVLTGVNQTALRLQDEYADELDCDLVETTAHAGARPSHAAWQGKVFSRSGKSTKYPSFQAATGYGTVAGLGGVNCRHSYGPYVEGAPRIWTDEQLKKLEEKSISYNGERITEYEASQRQRAIERKIRQWKRAEALGVDGAPEKVALWQETQRDFIRQTGMRRQYGREQIPSVGIAKSAKAGIMKSGGGSLTISSIDSPIEGRNTGRGKPGAILHYDVELNTRQQTLLDSLQEYNSRTTVPKSDVGMTDLAALTAKTGDEFALFTKGGERLIVRGNSYCVDITPEEAHEMGLNGYTWSGHTHPGTDFNVLQPSDGDYAILNQFNQENSAIYNSVGNYLIFERTEPYV